MQDYLVRYHRSWKAADGSPAAGYAQHVIRADSDVVAMRRARGIVAVAVDFVEVPMPGGGGQLLLPRHEIRGCQVLRVDRRAGGGGEPPAP